MHIARQWGGLTSAQRGPSVGWLGLISLGRLSLPAAASAMSVVILATVTAGLRLPIRSVLAPFPSMRRLDYSSRPSARFSALRAPSIAGVLGSSLPEY